MLKKLRLKFVLINMGIVAAMLLVIFATVYHFTKADLEKQSITMLDKLSQSTRQPGGIHEEDILLPYFVIQINLRGEVVASGHTYFDLTDEELLQELIQRVLTAKKSSGFLERYELRYKAESGMGVQTLYFVDVSSQRAALSTLIQVCVLIGIFSLLAFLAVSILLAGWAVKPVEKAWQQQRQFVSDASHELKTPLTVIMSNAELLNSSECDEQDRLQFSQSILTMSQRMRSLVEGMLELARADNGQIRKNFTLLDYSKLVENALLPFEPVMFEKELILQSNVEPNIRLSGSGEHLHQVVDILLDNAAKYAIPGIVTVTLKKERSSCILTVSNPGSPIPKEDLERIFHRFYRTDTARTGTGSFGLGLPIAKGIVTEHNGKIWAQSNETGNCFFVQLPCVN